MSQKSATEFGTPVWVDYLIAFLLVVFLGVYSYGLFYVAPPRLHKTNESMEDQ